MSFTTLTSIWIDVIISSRLEDFSNVIENSSLVNQSVISLQTQAKNIIINNNLNLENLEVKKIKLSDAPEFKNVSVLSRIIVKLLDVFQQS